MSGESAGAGAGGAGRGDGGVAVRCLRDTALKAAHYAAERLRYEGISVSDKIRWEHRYITYYVELRYQEYGR